MRFIDSIWSEVTVYGSTKFDLSLCLVVLITLTHLFFQDQEDKVMDTCLHCKISHCVPPLVPGNPYNSTKLNHIHHFYLPTCKGIKRKECGNGMLSEIASIQASPHEKLYNLIYNEDWLAAIIMIHLQSDLRQVITKHT